MAWIEGASLGPDLRPPAVVPGSYPGTIVGLPDFAAGGTGGPYNPSGPVQAFRGSDKAVRLVPQAGPGFGWMGGPDVLSGAGRPVDVAGLRALAGLQALLTAGQRGAGVGFLGPPVQQRPIYPPQFLGPPVPRPTPGGGGFLGPPVARGPGQLPAGWRPPKGYDFGGHDKHPMWPLFQSLGAVGLNRLGRLAGV